MADPVEPDPKTRAAGPADPGGSASAEPYSPSAVHLLRTVQINSLTLSQMADHKASILMGATLLAFSISLGRSLGGELPWSLVVLAAFAFCSSLCAVMAVLPSLGKSPSRSQNYLFFGHFHDLDEEDWTRQVLSELQSDERVFRLILRDIYQNGQVLQRRKYRFLTYAYRLLVVGLLATLMTFAAEFALTY